MPEACGQCAVLERQLSEIKDAIADVIGPRLGLRARNDKPHLLVSELLRVLTEVERSYRSHKVSHEGNTTGG